MLFLISHRFFWLFLALFAFILLPSKALQYGFLGATSQEFLQAMGWYHWDIATNWFASLFVFPLFRVIKNKKIRSVFEVLTAGIIFAFVIISASLQQIGLGYAVIFLFLALVIFSTKALAQLQVWQGDQFLIGAFIIIVGSIISFILYPISALFVSVWAENGTASLLENAYLTRIIFNSLSVSFFVGICATILGLIFALYTTRIASRQIQFLSKTLSILPMITPPFVVSLGVTLMLGRSGYLTDFFATHFQWSRSWLYGFNGIAISHILALTPMAFMILENALKSINVTLEEASYSLKANRYQTFRHITLPLLKPALANAFLIVTVQSLTDFGTPFVLGGNFDVLATQIYFYIVGTQPDHTVASELGIILLSFSLLVFLIQYWWIGKHSYTTVSGKAHRVSTQPLPSGLKFVMTVMMCLWGGFSCVLYGSVVYGSFTVNWGIDHTFTLENYRQLFGQGIEQGAFPSLIQTVLYSLIAAPISAILSLILAYMTVRRQFWGKKALEFVVLLCFAVPGTVAGVAYLFAFNHAPLYLTGTSAIIILSMVMRNMPIGMRACVAGLRQIDRSLDEASLSLKVSSFKTLIYVLYPLLKPAFLSALVTSFVRAMTTVSAIIFLVSPSTRVASSYILNRVEDGDYGLAVAYGTSLIAVMLAVIGVFNLLVGKKRI